MNIEALKISNPNNSETSSPKTSSNGKSFSKILTKANNSISTKEKNEDQNNYSNKKITKKQKVETVDNKESQVVKEVEDTEKSKESEATSSRYKFDFSKGLEGLLGSVSKLIDNSDEDQTISVDDLSSILNASSIQQLGDILGLNLEQSDISDGVSLKKILQALGIDNEDFQNAIQQLTGDNNSTGKDVWELLAGIGQNQQIFMQNLLTTIKGDSNAKVSKSQAAQILQVLKVIELTAPKTDLLLKQEYQTFQLKEMLSELSSRVEQTQTTSDDTNLAKVNKVQQLNVKVADATTSENVSSIQTTTNKATTTITITLPTNKASQAEAFVKEFQAIMNRSQLSNNVTGTKLLIKLYPENLGSIRVELMQKDGVMTARFLASTNIGKQMLESQLQQLKQGLVNQNIQLDRIDVAQALTETNRNEKEHQQQFQHAFKQHSDEQQKQNKDNDEEKSNFNDILMDMEV